MAALRADLGRLATELAERIVGETMQDSKAQGRVVDRFLADLDSSEDAARESKGAR